jgi:hypothetical protein
MTRDKELAMTGRKQAQSDRRQGAPNSTALLEGAPLLILPTLPLKFRKNKAFPFNLSFSPQPVNGTSKGRFVGNAAGSA